MYCQRSVPQGVRSLLMFTPVSTIFDFSTPTQSHPKLRYGIGLSLFIAIQLVTND
ncbi:hypothetical protein NIES2111_03730 [Nostoc sp. NIES-2111]|nr:hypothetical protein NIES2111_03730 [Nostoc sp. NIES-2111]